MPFIKNYKEMMEKNINQYLIKMEYVVGKK